jgi:hypothetical protein
MLFCEWKQKSARGHHERSKALERHDGLLGLPRHCCAMPLMHIFVASGTNDGVA